MQIFKENVPQNAQICRVRLHCATGAGVLHGPILILYISYTVFNFPVASLCLVSSPYWKTYFLLSTEHWLSSSHERFLEELWVRMAHQASLSGTCK